MNKADTDQTNGNVNIIRTTSTFDCGGRCPLKLHVKDNRILRIEGDDIAEPDQLRTCLRCRAFRQYVHHPQRLMYPQKRAGKRGEGKFERISWDKAFTILADQLTRVKETYGNGSIFLATGGGYLAGLHNGGFAAQRLLLSVEFDAAGAYLGPEDIGGRRDLAISLSEQLASFNRGVLCQ